MRPEIAIARAPEDAQAGRADVELSATQLIKLVVVGIRQGLLFQVGKHPDEEAAANVIAVGWRDNAVRPAVLPAMP